MGGYQGDDVTFCDVKCGLRRQQRAAIECMCHEVIKQAGIVKTLQKVYRDKALYQLTVCQWLDTFK